MFSIPKIEGNSRLGTDMFSSIGKVTNVNSKFFQQPINKQIKRIQRMRSSNYLQEEVHKFNSLYQNLPNERETIDQILFVLKADQELKRRNIQYTEDQEEEEVDIKAEFDKVRKKKMLMARKLNKAQNAQVGLYTPLYDKVMTRSSAAIIMPTKSTKELGRANEIKMKSFMN